MVEAKANRCICCTLCHIKTQETTQQGLVGGSTVIYIPRTMTSMRKKKRKKGPMQESAAKVPPLWVARRHRGVEDGSFSLGGPSKVLFKDETRAVRCTSQAANAISVLLSSRRRVCTPRARNSARVGKRFGQRQRGQEEYCFFYTVGQMCSKVVDSLT